MGQVRETSEITVPFVQNKTNQNMGQGQGFFGGCWALKPYCKKKKEMNYHWRRDCSNLKKKEKMKGKENTALSLRLQIRLT